MRMHGDQLHELVMLTLAKTELSSDPHNTDALCEEMAGKYCEVYAKIKAELDKRHVIVTA